MAYYGGQGSGAYEGYQYYNQYGINPAYWENNCPEPLIWFKDDGYCNFPCPNPAYSDGEYRAFRLIDGIGGGIGFLCCYFYCFTCLFRPTLMMFPNSNTFFIHFNAGLFAMSLVWSGILGEELSCNNKYETADSSNPLCVISMIVQNYSLFSLLVWVVLYQFTIALRLSNININEVAWGKLKYIYFFLAQCSWSMVIIIVALAKDYTVFPPGFMGCSPLSNEEPYLFDWIAGFAVVTVLMIIFLFTVVYSFIKLMQLRSYTKTTPLRLLLRQIRLLIFWAYQTFLCVFYLYLYLDQDININSGDLYDEFYQVFLCVFTVPKHESWRDYCPYDLGSSSFQIMVVMHVVFVLEPIFLFLILGCRSSLFLYWKEYFLFMRTNKTFVFPYHMTVDASHEYSYSSSKTRSNPDSQSQSATIGEATIDDSVSNIQT